MRRHGGRPYLSEPVFNTHIAFDSEYYLSIAVVGYDDTEVPQYTPPRGPMVPLNYAFMPAYPFAMRIVAAPAAALGMEPVTAAAFAGIAVSLVAALVAMLALHRLARPQLGEDGGVRAAFYLLIFPTGFFLAQVYSEAFFLAAAFGALAFLADRRPLPAGLLAIVAVLTRPVGLALVFAIGVALVLVIVRSRRGDSSAPSRTEWASWAFALIGPVVAYAVWATSAMGQAFEVVQREYFGRGLLNLDMAWDGWTNALAGLRRRAAADAGLLRARGRGRRSARSSPVPGRSDDGRPPRPSDWPRWRSHWPAASPREWCGTSSPCRRSSSAFPDSASILRSTAVGRSPASC